MRDLCRGSFACLNPKPLIQHRHTLQSRDGLDGNLQDLGASRHGGAVGAGAIQACGIGVSITADAQGQYVVRSLHPDGPAGASAVSPRPCLTKHGWTRHARHKRQPVTCACVRADLLTQVCAKRPAESGEEMFPGDVVEAVDGQPVTGISPAGVHRSVCARACAYSAAAWVGVGTCWPSASRARAALSATHPPIRASSGFRVLGVGFRMSPTHPNALGVGCLSPAPLLPILSAHPVFSPPRHLPLLRP